MYFSLASVRIHRMTDSTYKRRTHNLKNNDLFHVLYFKVFLLSDQDNLALYVQNCYATDGAYRTKQKYFLVR